MIGSWKVGERWRDAEGKVWTVEAFGARTVWLSDPAGHLIKRPMVSDDLGRTRVYGMHPLAGYPDGRTAVAREAS